MRSRKWAMVALSVLLLAAAGGGMWWYLSVPHSAADQFAAADKLEKLLRGDAATKSLGDLKPQIDECIEQYRRVGTRFGWGIMNPTAANAIKRIAKIQEEVAKEPKATLVTLDDLIKYYPDDANAGFALIEQARLIKIQANELKAARRPDTRAKFEEAIAKLEKYREQFGPGPDTDMPVITLTPPSTSTAPLTSTAPATAPATAPVAPPAAASAPAPAPEKPAATAAAKPEGKQSQAALMEIGRIWQDGIGEPLIKPIEIFTKFLRDYPKSAMEDEALFRLARAYEKGDQFDQALQIYTKLIEEYPKSKYSADATYSRGKILADKMDNHDEAAKDFQKMAQEFPDDPRNPAEEARKEQNKTAKDEGEKYAGSRYGGAAPFDTSGDKALPPADQFKLFTAQKLDAEDYDLNVDFKPAEHRITVNGTLKLTNRGDDKKDLLLMLGAGLTLSNLTVDGAPAQSKHTGETLQIMLPNQLKKDAPATLAFTYTGLYADPKETNAGIRSSIKPATAPSPSTTPATATAPSTGPASKPAPPPPLAGTTPLKMDMQMGLGDFGYALSGAAWYPITIIGDVFQAHMVFKVPAGMEAVANGAVVKRDKALREGDTGTFEFQTKNPVFGLYFAYGPYVVQEKQVGDIHFYTYLREANKDKHDAYVAITDKILSFYGSKFDGFPYEKMAIVDTPLPPVLGGVGPASLMFLQQTMVDHPEVPENLLAHELAHQWFGNLVPINITDPGYNQWLSEGFATYCDALYTEFKDGPKAFQLHIQQYDQLYFTFAMSAPKGSGAIKDTFSPMSALYRPVVYEKGALVLHMLRKVIGDDKFFALMRKYVETYKNKPTTVDDFRHMASESCGEDLSWFFSEWIDQAVFVHWKVKATVAPDPAGFKTSVMVTAPDSLVKMPADISFLGADGERFVKKNVMLDKIENPVDATTPFNVTKVIVDEDNWVLKRPGTDNIWTAPGVPTTTP